ncbi:Inner membrane protein YiaV precursor [Novipirellula aureliae]|uniref:Inner membrane protein YiaV n=1 Tax=Novipirellula aureliae TaxID=2527966 RepID=A0A5C6DHN2_9BACT|nr:efflux RND transporter periplasmic adaptor subunit [Novipirellula aureliae]TWU35221.1 Inner membrane protein YiaV precursor [Novipirellula aureliae]
MKVAIRIVILFVLIGGVIAGYWCWQSSRAVSDANELTLYGNIDIRQVELAINGSERIAELLVEEGDVVKKGQLLAKLETSRLKFSVDRAEAQVEMQQQVVARLEAGSRPEEIAKARADVQAAKATENDARRTHQRIAKLARSNASSQREADDALAAYESAVARRQALQATLDLAMLGPRKEEIAEARAALKGYKAELDQKLHDLQDASLYAPSDGVIQNRILEVGDMASPQKTVYTMALTDPVWVRAYVAEPDLGKVFEGMKADVMTDSFPGKVYKGWVGFISPTAEFTPKPVETRELRTKLVYPIRVFVKNPSNELRLGMPATVKIRLDQVRSDKPNAIAEPLQRTEVGMSKPATLNGSK